MNQLKHDSKMITTSGISGGIIILILYALFFCIITYFHEPWFDEAQAWEIGKTATYWEMLTVLTHTEGHPPLWSLLLSIPAKLGVPYLIGLKSISFIFSIIVVYLIVFKSPFPKIIRYMLPFTYFIFYQYGVISRTYCVMEFACVLIAMTFKDRNVMPWRFIGSLYLLCLTSAYGILIAGGICVCWVWDIAKEFIIDMRLFYIFKDKRVWSLIALLMSVLVVIYFIIPTGNTYAADRSIYRNLLKKLVYFIFAMTGDSFVSAGGIPLWYSFTASDVYPGLISSVLIWAFIILISRKNEIKYYLLPMLFFSLFMIYYGFDHHTGICFIWVVCYTWSIYDSEYIHERLNLLTTCLLRRLNNITEAKAEQFFRLLLIVFLGISTFYCIETSIEDIVLPYSETAEVADFIKSHNMKNAIIMIQWDQDIRNLTKDEQDVTPDVDKYESESTFDAVSIIPYFDKNIFFNHNIRNHDKGYSTHLKLSREENVATYELWRDYGIPEVLVEECCLPLVYKDEISIADYVHVKTCWGYYMGKRTGANKSARIYVRKDCLEKFGVTGINEINKKTN